MIHYKLFTDGSGNAGAGASAGLIRSSRKEETRLVSALGEATNNEAELFAAIMGLHKIYEIAGPNAQVEWVSDSQYCLQGTFEWFEGWERKGWTNPKAEKKAKNLGYFLVLRSLIKLLKVKGTHVRGHSGHLENEQCDSICTQIQKQQRVDPDVYKLKWVTDPDYDTIWTFLDYRKEIDLLRKKG